MKGQAAISQKMPCRIFLRFLIKSKDLDGQNNDASCLETKLQVTTDVMSYCPYADSQIFFSLRKKDRCIEFSI